jgi:hypothetical protein
MSRQWNGETVNSGIDPLLLFHTFHKKSVEKRQADKKERKEDLSFPNKRTLTSLIDNCPFPTVSPFTIPY